MPNKSLHTKLHSKLDLIPQSESGLIQKPFLHFPVNTCVYEILNWLEDNFSPNANNQTISGAA